MARGTIFPVFFGASVPLADLATGAADVALVVTAGLVAVIVSWQGASGGAWKKRGRFRNASFDLATRSIAVGQSFDQAGCALPQLTHRAPFPAFFFGQSASP